MAVKSTHTNFLWYSKEQHNPARTRRARIQAPCDQPWIDARLWGCIAYLKVNYVWEDIPRTAKVNGLSGRFYDGSGKLSRKTHGYLITPVFRPVPRTSL